MSESTKRQPSILGGILKFFGFMILAGVIIVVGFYCYLRFALGIDLIDIKRKIDLLNVKVEETQIITNPYEDADAANAFAKIFGSEEIYKDNGEGYVFDKTTFETSALVADVNLTDKEFAGLISIYMQKLYSNNQEDFAQNIKLKQIKFSNFSNSAEKTSVNISAVAMLDFSTIKSEIGKEDNVISGFLSSFVPENIYINCNFKVIVDNSNPESIIVESNYVLINQLSKEQSDEILDFINNFMDTNSNFMSNALTETFSTVLFGSAEETSIFDMISGFSHFTFESDGINIYLSIKKV